MKKKYNFRFSDETIEKLDELKLLLKVNSRTAVLEHLVRTTNQDKELFRPRSRDCRLILNELN